MKIKTILMSMLAVAALASCNKDEAGNAPEVGNSSMQLKIAVPETYAIQDPGAAAAPKLISVRVELLNATSVLETRNLTTAQIASAQTADGTVLEQIPDAATSVKVIANGLATPSTAIADYQTKLAEVPFSGTGNITYTDSDTNADGHKLKKATVTIMAEVARIEIVGGINVNETTNGYYAVDVEKVYINNYLAESDATTPTYVVGAAFTGATNFADDEMMNTIAIPETGAFYATDHNIGILTDKADAYQIFPAKDVTKIPTVTTAAAALPHVVLKVKVYETAEAYTADKPMAGREWITIKTFKKSSELLTEFAAGNIYKLDLNDLTNSFKPGVTPPVDPDPETEKADLELKVKVTPWVLVNMTPNI